MEITSYTLENCPSCGYLKELFKRANVDYNEVVVRKDITVEEFGQLYPGISNFPYVIIDGEVVGDLLSVAKLFVQKGLVSSNKE